MTLSTFQKCLFELWLACFFLVVTKKAVLRTSSDLSTRNNTCFLFKCRLTLAALVMERQVWYFRFLHPAFQMSCDMEYLKKNSFCFLSKKQTFQNDVEYVPKMSFVDLVGLFLWFLSKQLF